MLLNFIVVQQFSLAIRRPFIAMALCTLGYFLSLSLGYQFSARIKISRGIFIFPLFMLQILFLILTQPLAFWLRDSLGAPWMYGILLLCLTFFSASWGALFLPMMLRSQPLSMSQAYRFEILGSLFALLMMPLLGKMGFAAVLSAYGVSWLLLCALLEAGLLNLTGMFLTGLLLLGNFPSLDRRVATGVYQRQYPEQNIQDVVYQKYSLYQKVEVTVNDRLEKMLLLNGKRQFAPRSHETYSYFVADLPSRLMDNPSVLVLGCGSMSTVGRIGNRAARFMIVDIDAEVFKASELHFQDYNHLSELKNWTFAADDASHFLGNTSHAYDLILHDIFPARSRQTALTYTREFFQQVKKRLSPRGLFSISSLTSLESSSGYGRNLLTTLISVFEHYAVIESKGDIYFYGALTQESLPSHARLIALIQEQKISNFKIYFTNDFRVRLPQGEVVTRNNLGDLVLA